MRVKDADFIENQLYYYFQPNGAEIVLKRVGKSIFAYGRNDLNKSVATRPIEDRIYENLFYYGGDLQEAQPPEYEQITLEEIK